MGMEKKLCLILKRLDRDKEIENLKKALKRQKLARKEAEKILEKKSMKLYNSNQKLTELIANTNRFPEENPSPVLRFSAQGHVLMYNNKAGKKIIDFLDKASNTTKKKYFLGQLEYSFNEQKNFQFELAVDDSFFLINAVPFQSTNYVNIYANDITAIKKANEAVKQSEGKYRGVIENLNLGILEVDNNDKIIKAYPQFCSLIGYTEAELLGKSPTELFLDKLSRKIMERENEGRLKGNSSVYEVPLIKKNGDVVWVIISGAPFYNSDGMLEGTVGIHLDITERRIMEADLREAKLKAEELNEIKEMFLANMSHEIRTPMNAIVGMSELLSQSNLDETQSKYLSAISSSSKNLLVLINDLLDFSKIESGNLSLEMAEFNLNKLITKTIETVSLKADDNGVDIVCEMDPILPKMLNGDSTRLGQVLLNLLSNAVKFTINGSVKTTVKATRTKDDTYQITFVVKDEGIGIPKEELGNIFNDFSQATASTTRLYGGTGLGLSISQKIVRLMGGELEVESELNKGSEFFFSIELEGVDIDNAAYELSDNYSIEEDFNQSKILLVEDNPVNSLMATTILEKWNCRVDLAENGIESIEKLNLKSYDLILMDMTMPKMGGIEASQIIRKELKIETPIIALTANAIKGDLEKCVAAGMDDYLSKPYHQIDLNRVLTKWIEPNKEIVKESLINLSKLEEMGDPDFLEKMLNLFLVEAGKDITIIKKAIEQSDFDQIRSTAHKMKPSINYICIARLFEEVKAIEVTETNDISYLDRVSSFVQDLELVLKQLNQRK